MFKNKIKTNQHLSVFVVGLFFVFISEIKNYVHLIGIVLYCSVYCVASKSKIIIIKSFDENL